MLLQHKKITFAITNCVYYFERIIKQLEEIKSEGAEEIEKISENKIITSFEVINKLESDIMIIAPCSGNTIGKLTGGITDTPVLACAKANLKRGKNILIGITTNDGLSTSAENIGKLLNRKNYFFVPFRQDNPITKPNSLRMEDRYIKNALMEALEGKQIQPLLL